MRMGESIRMSSEDLEGNSYSVVYEPESAQVVVHEVVPQAAEGPVLAARGRWTKDHVTWEINRLGSGKAATVASVLAPHLVSADDSIGARSGWEGPCPVCVRAGMIPPRAIKATFGEALRGSTARCSDGHLVRVDDPDGRVARKIFLINDLMARSPPSASATIRGSAQQGPFRVAKMFDRGTDSPIVQRIVLQFFAILESGALALDPKTINGIKELLLETMRDLGHVQDAIDAYLRREDEAISALSSGGVRITHNAIYYDDPTVDLRKLFGDALTSVVIAFRDLPRLASAILGADLDGGKSWKKLRPLLATAAQRQQPGSKAVDDFYKWSEEVADLRGRFEHPHPPLDIAPVRVEVIDGKVIAVHAPRLLDPSVSLRGCLEPILSLAIDHMERLTAFLFGERCANGYAIARYENVAGAAFRFAPVKTG